MKVKIKKWSAVATWRWDIPEDDVCGICQIHFDGSCPSCRFPGDDCELCQPASLLPPLHLPPAKPAKTLTSIGQVWPQLPQALHYTVDQAGISQGTVPHVPPEIRDERTRGESGNSSAIGRPLP